MQNLLVLWDIFIESDVSFSMFFVEVKLKSSYLVRWSSRGLCELWVFMAKLQTGRLICSVNQVYTAETPPAAGEEQTEQHGVCSAFDSHVQTSCWQKCDFIFPSFMIWSWSFKILKMFCLRPNWRWFQSKLWFWTEMTHRCSARFELACRIHPLQPTRTKLS